MFKHIVFDFDGTLVDSTEAMLGIINDLAGKYNFNKLSQDEYRNLNTLPLIRRIKTLLFVIKIHNEFKRLYNMRLNSIRFYNGIKEVLIQLKESGYKLSIITSNSVDNTRSFFRSKRVKYI